MTTNLEPKKKPSSVVTFLVIIAGIAVFVCIGIPLLTGIVSGFTKAIVATDTPTIVVVAAGPTRTAMPVPTSRIQASTPTIEVPTAMPAVTTIPTPTAVRKVTLKEVASVSSSLTKIKWTAYLEQLQGAYADKWMGEIYDVSDSGTVIVNVHLSWASVQFNVTKDVALKFDKGQKITFSGNIKSTGDLLGTSIELENVIIEGM